MATETFPIDLRALKPLKLDPKRSTISPDELATLQHNVQLCRDAIVFFTALAGARGLSGHTGGAYDIVPETLIIRAFVDGGAPILPIYFDEAGHRVAIVYLMAAIDGHLPAEKLLHYREYNSRLPGHPERGFTPGVQFSSGRLGHCWAMANGLAMANPGKAVFVLGSDGAQMEGDNAEAARLAVAQKLNLKVLVDDNNVTIAGHPNEYMPGYDVAQTLHGHGLPTETVTGEDFSSLYASLARAFSTNAPHAVVVKRKMAPGIEGVEGEPHAHEVVKAEIAIKYLEKRGNAAAIELLKAAKADKSPLTFKGSSGVGKNRDDFGKIVNEIIGAMSKEDRVAKVRVFDNDLEGSCGLHHIRKSFPEVFVRAGIMERGNFSASAGFGFDKGRQGIFATFSAFLEMCISEITMARLNHCNVLAHFSHSGVDDMADNTCHFGINSMFADGGLDHDHPDNTRLYFPVDQHQFAACVKAIFNQPGLRFVFSTRSPVPDILDETGQKPFFKDRPFEPGKDYEILDAEGGGYVVAVGEAVYRAMDAVLTLREQGVKAGLIVKSTLNTYDPQTMKLLAGKAPWVLVAEGFNVKTGVGSRFGSALLKAGFKGKYNHIGTNKEGCGGLWQQMGHQGLDSAGIQQAIKALV
jgi:transketolase